MNDGLPRRYGPLQLFAFSGCEGPTDPWHGLVGSALADRCGYWFHVNGEIWNDHGLRCAIGIDNGDGQRFDLTRSAGFEPRIVLGDTAEFALDGPSGPVARFTMVDDRTCRIECDAPAANATPVLAITAHPASAFSRMMSADTRDRAGPPNGRLSLRYCTDAWTLATRNGRFEPAEDGWRLRTGRSIDAAVTWHPANQTPDDFARAFAADTTALRERRVAWARGLPLPRGISDPETVFLRRCAVSLRTNTYSPHGLFPAGATTPDRWPHRNIYLWDSAFQAIGIAAVDPPAAWRALSAMWAHTSETGFVWSMLAPTGPGEHFETNSPVLAWAAEEIADLDPHPDDPLADAYPHLARYVDDALARRNPEGLVVWDRFSHGMDNSPRFDAGPPAVFADANLYLANELRALASIARRIGRPDDATRWDLAFADLADAANRNLWDPDREWYFDLDRNGALSGPRTPVAFAAVLSGVADRADRSRPIVRALLDASVFARPLPIPTVAADEDSYGDNMWRGPAWPNLAWLAFRTLRSAGRRDHARALARRWLDEQRRWYEECGGIFEFYDAEAVRCPLELPRKSGIGALNDYGWGVSIPLAFAQALAGDPP